MAALTEPSMAILYHTGAPRRECQRDCDRIMTQECRAALSVEAVTLTKRRMHIK